MSTTEKNQRPMDAAQPDAMSAALRRPLIIERGDLQTIRQRWGYRGLTLACWALWLYLFMPLLSVVAWAAGLTLVYQVLLQGLNVVDFWIMVRWYGMGIGILGGLYMFWAITSYLRFRGVDRRRHAQSVDDGAMAQWHHLSAEELHDLRDGNLQTVPAEQLERMFSGSR